MWSKSNPLAVFALDLMSAYEGEHTIFGLLGQANLTQNVEYIFKTLKWRGNPVTQTPSPFGIYPYSLHTLFFSLVEIHCTYNFVFCFSSCPYNIIFLCKHLFLSPVTNSHRISRSGNKSFWFILEKRQSDKILGKEKHRKTDLKRDWRAITKKCLPFAPSWMWKSGSQCFPFFLYLIHCVLFYCFLYLFEKGSLCVS
jgi:hypothetical protein